MKPLIVPKSTPDKSKLKKIMKKCERQNEKISPPEMLPSVIGAKNFEVAKRAIMTIIAEEIP